MGQACSEGPKIRLGDVVLQRCNLAGHHSGGRCEEFQQTERLINLVMSAPSAGGG